MSNHKCLAMGGSASRGLDVLLGHKCPITSVLLWGVLLAEVWMCYWATSVQSQVSCYGGFC